MEWVELLAVALSSGVITSSLTIWANRRKTQAEARKLEAEADTTLAAGYDKLIAALTAQQNDTTRQVAELLTWKTEAQREILALRNENTELRGEVTRLQGIILRAGIDPDTGVRLDCPSPEIQNLRL